VSGEVGQKEAFEIIIFFLEGKCFTRFLLYPISGNMDSLEPRKPSAKQKCIL
jgi:hypothetical protein